MERLGLKFEQDIQPERVDVETPEARFVIIYHNHQSKEEIFSGFVDEVDGVIFETEGSPYHSTQEMIEDVRVLLKITNQGRIVKRLMKQEKSIFFTSISYRGNLSKPFYVDWEDKNKRIVVEGLMGLLSFYIGGKLTYTALRSKEKINRREFLKMGVSLGLGAYLTAPVITEWGLTLALGGDKKIVDEQSLLRQTQKKLRDFNQILHPELDRLTLTARNNLTAQKSGVIARLLKEENRNDGKLNKKPVIGIVVGLEHSGIEKALLSDEKDRVAALQNELGAKVEQEKLIARIKFYTEKNKHRARVSIMNDTSLE